MNPLQICRNIIGVSFVLVWLVTRVIEIANSQQISSINGLHVAEIIGSLYLLHFFAFSFKYCHPIWENQSFLIFFCFFFIFIFHALVFFYAFFCGKVFSKFSRRFFENKKNES